MAKLTNPQTCVRPECINDATMSYKGVPVCSKDCYEVYQTSIQAEKQRRDYALPSKIRLLLAANKQGRGHGSLDKFVRQVRG
tara:strand:+ start:5882 stop:6127 length:246 start_codon:yes stop_codon:yes gene_type:complete